MNSEVLPDVSRETIERLEQFGALVERWTKKINLISKSSVNDIWDRHILDSVQLYHLMQESGLKVDIGSGGGFPGIVLAILDQQSNSQVPYVLVESDARKAVFLRTAARELDLQVDVISKRIEDIDPLNAQWLSARALAPLEILLEYARLHLASDGAAIFPKGKFWREEEARARNEWQFDLTPVQSRTESDAAILIIKDIVRA